MQINKITEYTKVVHVHSSPGAHQTKPFLVSAALFVCSHFFPSIHRSLLGKPLFLFLFPPPVFWTSLFSSTQPRSIVHANKLSSLKQSLQQVMGGWGGGGQKSIGPPSAWATRVFPFSVHVSCGSARPEAGQVLQCNDTERMPPVHQLMVNKSC